MSSSGNLGNSSEEAQIAGAEETANKNVANGYMGTDANNRGSQPPKTHDHSAAGDQAGTIAYSSVTGKSVALADLAQATIDVIMPWRVDVIPQAKDALAASVGTWTISNNVPNALHSAQLLNSPTAQNDSFSIDLILAKGTWKMLVYFNKFSTAAIATCTIDSAAPSTYSGSGGDTFDTYSAGTTYNQLYSVTGIVLPATAKRRFTYTAATRNGSSTGWALAPVHMSLVRTA